MISALEVPSSCTTTEATANPPIAVSRGGFSLAGLKFDTKTCAVAWVAKRTAETANSEMTVLFMDFPQGFSVHLHPRLDGHRCTRTVACNPSGCNHPTALVSCLGRGPCKGVTHLQGARGARYIAFDVAADVRATSGLVCRELGKQELSGWRDSARPC